MQGAARARVLESMYIIYAAEDTPMGMKRWTGPEPSRDGDVEVGALVTRSSVQAALLEQP